MLDIAPGIRTAIIDEASISGLLSEWQGEPAVFTRRPTPPDATGIMVVISEDIAVNDFDGVDSDRPMLIRDVLVYGDNPDQYREVEVVAYAIRQLFHRNKASITNDEYYIIDVVASGPSSAPTSDDEIIGRVVSLTVKLRNKEL